MEKIFVLGASGLVGKAVTKELQKDYEVYGTYHKNEISSDKFVKFNVNDENKIADIFNAIKPSGVVYCLTGDFSCQINVLNQVVKYLKECSGRIYFCSTANVFDNDSTKPHYKNDETGAESDYGKFKIQCEKMLRSELEENSVIFRLPAIWGKDSPRLNQIKSALKNNEKIHVYTNLYQNNNVDEVLARQIGHIIRNGLTGTFHLGSKDIINYYDFIKGIVDKLGFKNAAFDEEVLPEEKYYLAVLPEGDELPEKYYLSNKGIISYLA